MQDGRPIYVEILGKIDLTKLFAVTTPERQLQRLVTEYEKFLRDRCASILSVSPVKPDKANLRLPVSSEVKGQLIETSCTIMDLKDVGISQFWKVKGQVQAAAGSESTTGFASIAKVSTCFAVSSNNYPETMGKFYIVRGPPAPRD